MCRIRLSVDVDFYSVRLCFFHSFSLALFLLLANKFSCSHRNEFYWMICNRRHHHHRHQWVRVSCLRLFLDDFLAQEMKSNSNFSIFFAFDIFHIHFMLTELRLFVWIRRIFTTFDIIVFIQNDIVSRQLSFSKHQNRIEFYSWPSFSPFSSPVSAWQRLCVCACSSCRRQSTTVVSTISMENDFNNVHFV